MQYSFWFGSREDARETVVSARKCVNNFEYRIHSLLSEYMPIMMPGFNGIGHLSHFIRPKDNIFNDYERTVYALKEFKFKRNANSNPALVYYVPDDKAKEGKLLIDRIAQVNKHHANFSRKIIDYLGLNRPVMLRSKLLFPYAKCDKDDNLYILVPWEKDENYNLPSNKHNWLRPPRSYDEYMFFMRGHEEAK
jgi:hypothetical protein